MTDPSVPDRAPPFIVGVGASAGGLEALQRLFESVRPSGRLAFVVVQHLSPDFRSLMDELLSRHTTLAIHRAETGMRVEADALYLLPPGKEMIIANGALVLRDRGDHALSLPIDVFFASLAEDAGPRSVAVVLSGTGSDGSRGLRAVHEAGGLVIAQDEASAKFDGMPRSAVDTGLVDLVLPPEEIAGALERYAERGGQGGDGLDAAVVRGGDEMKRLFELLRKESGIDFSGYKPTTVTRRIERRIALADAGTLEDYLARVERDPEELRALYKDLLIGVTRFFRDPEAFEVIRRTVLPQVVERLVPGEELRLWVPACATGEEAYGLAILAFEALREAGREPAVKVFATDAHRASLEVASAGVYGPDAVAPVPADLRERWFEHHEGRYQVAGALRNALVFAAHNLLRDAPFTRVDLISCRNLLIYLKPPAQKKILSLFHFALKPQGALFLGPSEGPGALADEFDPLDVHWKIFRKRRDVRLPAEIPPSLAAADAERRARAAAPAEEPRIRAAREQLLRRWAPPTLLVDGSLRVLHAFNGAGRFLVQRDGPPSTFLLDLVAGELKFVIAAGVKRVQKEHEPVTYGAVEVASAAGGHERVRVTVALAQASPGPDAPLLVTFEPEPALATSAAARETPGEDMSGLARERIAALEHELRSARENLQATVEEMETSNEELQATNEELIASNEELQSTNEELHSVNEELYTVNAEHQAKIAELTELTADMNHLLETTQVHTLFLDRELRIRKFTPKLAELFNLLPQDTGRPIEGFAHLLDHPGLLDDLRAVLASGNPVERDVSARGSPGAFLLRVLPYRPRAEIEGVVATLVDVTLLAQARREVGRSAERYRTLLRTMSSVVWTAGRDGRFDAPQPEWEAYTGQRLEEHRGDGWLAAFHPDDRPAIRQAWTGAVERGEPWTAAGRLRHGPTGDYRWFTLRAAPVLEDGAIREWVGNIVDVHAARVADAELHAKTAQLAGILENSPSAIWVKDLAGRYLLANRETPRVLGAGDRDLVGRSDHDLLPRERADAVRAAEQEVLATGATVATEDLRPGPDGERTFQTVRFPLRDVAGRVVAVAGIATDVTVRKRAELESREAVERRDQLLAMLSHELRTPLGAIMHAAELLERQAHAPERRALRIIRRQSRHMSRLLDDLLDVARVTRGQLVLDRRRVDLATMVREAVEAAQAGAEKKGLALTADVPEAPVPVLGDPVRLNQIVSNLLANAVKYTPQGSIRVALESDGRRARVHVRDSGIGLSPEERARVFDIFYQASPTIDRHDGGLGIGLTLAQAIARVHGGDVTATSEGKGKGSDFVLSLPLAPPAPQEEAPPPRPRPGRLRVAIVEDNDDIREIMRELLELEGHEVVEAADGPRGVELIVRAAPDVAFVDIGLPGMSGHEVARNVRRALGGEVRLVALTGYGRPEDRAAALEAGYDDHVVKPVESEHLVRALAALPARARSSA